MGPYIWKTYKEVYDEVLHVGSALRASGVEPVRINICQFSDALETKQFCCLVLIFPRYSFTHMFVAGMSGWDLWSKLPAVDYGNGGLLSDFGYCINYDNSLKVVT